MRIKQTIKRKKKKRKEENLAAIKNEKEHLAKDHLLILSAINN
jgi:hypothetical protein